MKHISIISNNFKTKTNKYIYDCCVKGLKHKTIYAFSAKVFKIAAKIIYDYSTKIFMITTHKIFLIAAQN
jgi:hypothetical protein